MNVDSFKARLIAATGAKGLSWKENDEFKGDGANITTQINLPNFQGAAVDVYLHASSLEVNFVLNQVRANEDTLLLINDFNKNVTDFKAYMEEDSKGRSFLFVSSNQIHVANEDSGVQAFDKIMKAMFSEEVNTFFRPLTIIAK